MDRVRRPNHSVHWFIDELSHRVVAESGRPSDRHHLGKLILQSLKDAPEFVLQMGFVTWEQVTLYGKPWRTKVLMWVLCGLWSTDNTLEEISTNIDGANGKSESFGSVLERSVQCANAFRAMGLQTGDVIVLMAPNHLDLCIPYYAALYLGVAIASIDFTLGVKELVALFLKDDPKLVFCQSEKATDVRDALNKANLAGKLVLFDREMVAVETRFEYSLRFDELLKQFGQDTDLEDFKAADFNPESTIAYLVSTSGTTGFPKQAATTHKNIVICCPLFWCQEFKFPTPFRLCLNLSPLQWVSGLRHLNMSAILRYTRLQTSKPTDNEHVCALVNKYKPAHMLISPTMLTSLMNYSYGRPDRCDWTCFETIVVGGATVSPELIRVVKEMTQSEYVYNGYGMSETCGMAFTWTLVPKSSGRPCPHLLYRLVKVGLQKDIMEPNVPGELWVKGPSVFKEYYKDEKATKEALTEDGWFKTGDLFYRDEHWNFFFVERIKMLLKYKSHQVSPAEIQDVIMTHPAVQDCAVCGLPDPECGDLPVACVVRKPGLHITAEEVKNLVKENLTDSKQLRGGVIFLDQLPLSPTGKTNYKELKETVLTANRE